MPLEPVLSKVVVVTVLDHPAIAEPANPRGPHAKTFLVTGGTKEQREGKTQVFPIGEFLRRLSELI